MHWVGPVAAESPIQLMARCAKANYDEGKTIYDYDALAARLVAKVLKEIETEESQK